VICRHCMMTDQTSCSVDDGMESVQELCRKADQQLTIMTRPKSAKAKDINTDIADILGQKYHRDRIDIGKNDIDPSLACALNLFNILRQLCCYGSGCVVLSLWVAINNNGGERSKGYSREDRQRRIRIVWTSL